MNNQLSIYRKASFYFGLALFTSLGFALPALGEGSQQLGNGSQGLNVYLFEYNATNSFVQANQGPRPIKVNVENANQVINISLCGWNTADTLAIEVFRPSGTEINYTNQVAPGSPGAFNANAAGGAGAWLLTTGNARTAAQPTLCNNQSKPNQPTLNGTLSTPVRFVAPEAGTYEIRLHNDSLAANSDNNVFTYFDVTVTPNVSTNPDPRANKGQVWATSWAFNAGNTFAASGGYDADLYIRTPGGRPGTGFVWQLDLNKFAPQRHEIIANGIGLDAPNSRGSAPGSSGATYTKNYPIYLSPPSLTSLVAPILPEPAPPSISNLRFIDNAGEDNTISPTSTTGVQDLGFFRFNSDIAGTYKITIDTNQDGVFGTGDRVLFGPATSGANAVVWDGRGDNNAVLNPGSYPAQVNVGLGEYHFVTFDAETSGGGTNDGLSIWKWNGSSRSAISNFWDDTKIISSAGATKNLVGGLSGTPAGTHTWGNFAAGSIGDNNYLDTWVFGTPQILTTKTIITTSDANDFGDAPDTYGTNKDITVGGTPASHLINPNLSLGVNAPDRDADGQPSVNADGDDINGTIPDDEDGVISFSPLIKNATTYSVKVRVKNITGAAASLGGWIDFNKDGQFQSSEGVVQSVPNNTNSDVTLTWNSLSGLVVGDIYARFRLNSDPLTTSDFNGGGRDGEVEDYKLAIQEVDYGDAPVSYDDTADNNNLINANDNPARHAIAPNLFLGTIAPDAEAAPQNSPNADKDDIATAPNVDDEDAFTNLPNVNATATATGNYSINVPVTNTSGGNAKLHGWIDFNKNGKFESGEYQSADVTDTSPVNLTWAVPAGTTPGNTYARFRLTSDASVNGNTPNGAANNGEVEDYPVAIVPAPLYDYGDAPDASAGTGTGNYKTTAADGGAAQVVIDTAGQVLSIGNTIDFDDGSLQSSNADEDDIKGSVPDDEDGVSSFPTLTTAEGQTYTVTVTAKNNVPAVPAYLVGFIDFNKDGDFEDTGEKSNIVTIASDANLTGTSGELRTFNVTFTTPTGMTPGDTYARFRLGQVEATAQQAAGASAGTDNGEVEDYKIAIFQDLSNKACPGTIADIWFAHDESGSVQPAEFTDGLDFIYQVSDQFVYDADNGMQAGLFGWALNQVNAIIPITDTFGDPDDSGLIADSNISVDNDGQGVREEYNTRLDNSNGTDLTSATAYLANLINTGNGRRTGIPQVAVLMTDAFDYQMTNEGDNGGDPWITAANNLRNAGPDGTNLIVVLIDEASFRYKDTANVRTVVDRVVGNGQLFLADTYTEIADPVNGYIDNLAQTICDSSKPVASDPNLLLVKRITAINPGENNEIQFNKFVNDDSNNDGDPNNDPDNDPNWPEGDNTYLRGAINVADIQPGDEVEYTIYFLSSGEEPATNIKICDVIPDNMSLVKDAYDVEAGVALGLNETALPTEPNTTLSNAADTDEGTFFVPGTAPPTVGNPAVNLCQKADTAGNTVSVGANENINGATVVELDSLPEATAPGTPANSYGFIRFRARVK